VRRPCELRSYESSLPGNGAQMRRFLGIVGRLGFERSVDAAIYQTVLEDQNAHAVIGTRCSRNG
jgi:hypothetical protein